MISNLYNIMVTIYQIENILMSISSINLTVTLNNYATVIITTSVLLSQVSPTVLKNTSSAYTNGRIQCRFQRSIASNQDKIFPLNSNYYLFLGYGPVDQTC